MKLRNYIGEYLTENEYKLVLKENSVYISNYLEILDFSNTEISIRHKKGITIINGLNLVIAKMLDDEILITGQINNLKL